MILLILLILVLGYYHCNNYLPAKIQLKRSAGWEAYVQLGSKGLYSLWAGAIISVFFYIFLKILNSFLALLYLVILNSKNTIDLSSYFAVELFTLAGVHFTPWHLLIIICAFTLTRGELQNKNKQIEKKYSELAKTTGLLSIVIPALRNQSLVKISLKSKKVYVGLIDSEQFEQADLDNILIIPFSSGYRDKDTLKLHLDCYYTDVYKKHGIDFESQDIQFKELRKFVNAIRVSEIESISFFNAEYFDDFYPKENTN